MMDLAMAVCVASNVVLSAVVSVLIYRLTHPKTRCFDPVLKMLADEQGDWFVEKILAGELGKLLCHGTTEYFDDEDSECGDIDDEDSECGDDDDADAGDSDAGDSDNDDDDDDDDAGDSDASDNDDDDDASDNDDDSDNDDNDDSDNDDDEDVDSDISDDYEDDWYSGSDTENGECEVVNKSPPAVGGKEEVVDDATQRLAELTVARIDEGPHAGSQ